MTLRRCSLPTLAVLLAFTARATAQRPATAPLPGPSAAAMDAHLRYLADDLLVKTDRASVLRNHVSCMTMPPCEPRASGSKGNVPQQTPPVSTT